MPNFVKKSVEGVSLFGKIIPKKLAILAILTPVSPHFLKPQP